MLLNSRLALCRLAVVIRIVRYLCTRPYHLNEDVLILSRCIELLRLGRKARCDYLNGHVAADLNQIHRSAAFRVRFDLKIAVVLAVYGGAEDNCRVDERLAIKALLDRYNDMGDQRWRLIFTTVLRILPVKNSR